MFRLSLIAAALAALACGSSAPVAAADPAPVPVAVVATSEVAPQAATPAAGAEDVPRPAREGETRQAMLARFGLSEDPGFEPDPDKVWKLANGRLVQIHRFPASESSYDGEEPGFVRPFGWGNFSREIFQVNSEYVWVFETVEILDGEVLPIAEAMMRRLRARQEADPVGVKAEAAEKKGWNEEQIGYARQILPDFELLSPQESDRRVRFREASVGLPSAGSWRNTGVFADMNRDGRMDVVIPPPRGGAVGAGPIIYLGDGTGNWRLWEEASFPIATNYGSVAVGDLNKDGHPDVVSGIHLTGVGIFLGGQDGYFTDVTPKMERQFDTRKAIIADLNADGHLDVAAVSEGPALMQANRRVLTHESHVIAFINDGTGRNWRQVDIAEIGRTTAGDWLVAGNFNGDRYPDLASGSTYFSGPDVMYMSDGNLKWKGFGRGWLPFYSYYGGVTAGKFDERSRTDQVVIAWARTWPRRAPLEAPERAHASGLDIVSWDGRGNPSRRSLVRLETRALIRAVTSGDFDGDGNLDIIYAQPDPHEFVLLLGDGRGGFVKAKLDGLVLAPNAIYDLTSGDANGDGRPDLLMLYERENASPGSVQVWLNEK